MMNEITFSADGKELRIKVKERDFYVEDGVLHVRDWRGFALRRDPDPTPEK